MDVEVKAASYEILGKFSRASTKLGYMCEALKHKHLRTSLEGRCVFNATRGKVRNQELLYNILMIVSITKRDEGTLDAQQRRGK